MAKPMSPSTDIQFRKEENAPITVNAEFSMQQSHALIRRIETDYTQATSGTRSVSFNLAANYVLNRRITVGAFIDHRINTPIVSSALSLRSFFNVTCTPSNGAKRSVIDTDEML